MKYLIIFGSSINKVFVNCFNCDKKFSWLRAYHDDKRGNYFALCSACKKKIEKELK
jgi:hypothetical protein